MSHQILTAKLGELEKRIAGMQDRIRLCESESLPELRAEIGRFRAECAENELTLQERLRHSKTEVAAILSSACGKIEPLVRDAREALGCEAQKYADREASDECGLLLAEYELDFSMLAIDRALLVSLEAIAAQLETLQGGSEP